MLPLSTEPSHLGRLRAQLALQGQRNTVETAFSSLQVGFKQALRGSGRNRIKSMETMEAMDLDRPSHTLAGDARRRTGRGGAGAAGGMINLETKTAIAWILSEPELVLMCADELTNSEVLCTKAAGLRLAALAVRLRYLATREQFQPALEIFTAIGDLDAVDWEEVLDALFVYCAELLLGEASASM